MTERDGPSLLEYCNTRFDLLAETASTREKSLEERFKHLEQLFALSTENAKRAGDKAEASQAAHNVAQNEWRATVNDFKSNTVSRVEFDRLFNDFAAYRLEIAKIIAAQVGEKTGTREVKDDSKWIITSIVAVGVAAVSVLGPLFVRPGAVPTAATTPQVIYVPAPAGSLLPTTPPQAPPR